MSGLADLTQPMLPCLTRAAAPCAWKGFAALCRAGKSHGLMRWLLTALRDFRVIALPDRLLEAPDVSEASVELTATSKAT